MKDFKKKENPVEQPDIFTEGSIEGRNVVYEALRAERSIDKIFIQDGEREGSLQRIAALAKDKGIVLIPTDRKKLNEMSQTGAHQGVIAMCAAKEYVSVDEILELARNAGEDPFLILCDEIYDPHNLGAIIRTAVAAGAHGIIIPKRRNVGLTPVVYKASAGMTQHISVAKVVNIAAEIDRLKAAGLWIYGADANGEKNYYESDFSGPVALVIGSEGQGLSRLIKEKCDFLVKIPMNEKVASLNASVAGAIMMYEILRQRNGK